MCANRDYPLWVFVNLLVPVFVPIFFSAAVRLGTYGEPRNRLNPIFLVKDGQLGWIALAFCAAAFYEIMGRSGIGYVIADVLLTVTACLSVLYAVMGASNPPPFPLTEKEHWYTFYATFATTCAASVVFSLIHYHEHYRAAACGEG